ncbi:transposase [Acetobacter oeni]|uniref:transposase n=1 Tax=Acetobacter oeni TaxID=304077 RepID=UPI0038CF5BF2
MKERLKTTEARDICRLQKQTGAPAFRIIKSVMGFMRFHLRGLAKIITELALIVLACNCKRTARLQAA